MNINNKKLAIMLKRIIPKSCSNLWPMVIDSHEDGNDRKVQVLVIVSVQSIKSQCKAVKIKGNDELLQLHIVWDALNNHSQFGGSP